MTQSRKKLLIIDTFYVMHRSFHAYPTTLTTSNGETINMVFGFASSLVDILATFVPDYVVCVWETTEQPSFRQGIYSGYQLNRMFGDADDEQLFLMQIPKIKKVIESLNIDIYHSEGFEGDDIIGTIAKNLEQNVDVVIYTADQDMLQLVTDKISVFRPAKPPFQNSKLFTPSDVLEKYGFPATSMIQYKALRGDPSDNIPGVKGVGEVTAKKLLAEYNDLENIYKNIDNIKPASLQNKLIKDKEMAFLSMQLATIITDVPIQFTLQSLEIKDLDLTKFEDLCKKFEFSSVLKKLNKLEMLFKSKMKKKETDQSQLNFL